MQKETLSIALKEWAVVQRSLIEGHQIVLLRKGGLIEESGDFDLRANRAFIFPTYEHETERLGDIQPKFAGWLREEEIEKPDVGTLQLSCFVDITDVVAVPNRDKLLAMSQQHIWSRQFIDGRYEWEPYKPIWALIVRAWVLPEEITVPMQKHYGGCKSWIELDTAVSTKGAWSTWTDEQFDKFRAATLKHLQSD